MGSSSRVVQIKGPLGIVVKRHFHLGLKKGHGHCLNSKEDFKLHSMMSTT